MSSIDISPLQGMLIDVTRLCIRLGRGRLPTGVDRVGLAYVERYKDVALATVRLKGRHIVVPKAASQQLFDMLLRPTTGMGWKIAYILMPYLSQYFHRAKLNKPVLLNTGHTGLEQSTYGNELRQINVKPVFLVHDLIPITHPEYCRPGEKAKHIQRMNNVLGLARGVLTNSFSTTKDLEGYAKASSFACPPVLSAPLASAPLPDTMANRPIEKPYFVILSTIEARKNHAFLLQLWRALVEQYGDATPHLVVIGQRGWECENAVDMLDRCDTLKGYVTEKSSCSDVELVAYLKHAQALLFPAFTEGYGMPLVEALTLGTPAIVSDIPVFKEIAQDVPEYCDPLDGEGWKALVMDYAKNDSTRRLGQVSKIQNYTRPTWEQHFNKVDNFLLQVQAAQ